MVLHFNGTTPGFAIGTPTAMNGSPPRRNVMEVKELAYGKERVLYVALRGERSVYFSSLTCQDLTGWQQGAINALIDKGVGDRNFEFFAVFIHGVAWPDSFSLGSPCVFKQIRYRGDGQIVAFMRVECRKVVLGAFQEKIAQAL